MDKTKLLSIGIFSKLTGVHIKSLRYYDEIGILAPAYVDPDTRYRYYSFSQIHVVDAIQLCIELDIPLKQFPEYIDPEQKQVHYARLLAKGTELAQEKIRSIQERLDFLQEIQAELLRNQALQRDSRRKTYRLPRKTCFTLPYTGAQNTVDYYKSISQLFHRIKHEGLKPKYDYGLLLLYKSTTGEAQQYVFADIDPGSITRPDIPGLVVLPPADYCFLQMTQSGIASAPQLFPELFSQDYDKVVMEVEPILEISSTSSPLLEIRCSLPPAGSHKEQDAL